MQGKYEPLLQCTTANHIFRWQKLRQAEITYETEIKQSALGILTTREREVRKRIEDALYPQSPSVKISRLTGPGMNGAYNPIVTDGIGKKGKR